MTHIFISYRRDDSSIATGHIYDRLTDAFGRSAIFKDVDSIPYGVNFAEHITQVIDKCAVQLVVIGPRWLDATDAQGQRRLDDPTDPVRLEIESAISRGIPIIPLMVDGASVPAAQSLPTTLRDLPLQNGATIRGTDFNRDLGKVSARLTKWVKPLPGTVSRPRRSLISAGLIYALTLALLDIPVAAVGAIWAGSLVRGPSTSGILTLIGFCLVPGIIICFLAGRSAARGSGNFAHGALAGLIAGVLGSLVGGAVFGWLLGTPAANSSASGSASSIQGDIEVGLVLWVIFAVVVGPAIGALGGLVGQRGYEKSAQTR